MTLPFKIGIIPVTPFQQNCALVWDETSLSTTVIDPGGDAPRIMAAVTQLKLRPRNIVLTHGHLDHAGGAAELRDLLQDNGHPGVSIEGPDERDSFLLHELEAQGRQYGVAMRDVTPDRWLNEGDTVAIAGHDFDVLHTPGHTPGHLSYVLPLARFAFVGDVLFRGSVGRTDFPYGDGDQLIASIRDKLLPLGDDVSFLCGHGPGSSFGTERRENPFLRDF